MTRRLAWPGESAARLAVVAAAVAALVIQDAWAQAPPPPLRGGVFVEPPADVDPRFLTREPNASDPAADAAPASHGLSIRLSADWPLRTLETPRAAGAGVQGGPPVSPTIQFGLRWTPIPQSAWFVQGTFYRYLREERQQPWNPDFSYGFGYDDWRPDTFSFTYANYAGNRFNPDPSAGERRWNFANGQWSAAYKFALPMALRPWFVIREDDQVTCSTGVNLTPRYTDRRSLSIRNNKTSLAFGCRYTMTSNLFASITFLHYPRAGQQQPWDPDFTYSFGHFNWRPGTASLQYSNYSGNRLPWRDRAANQGSFRNGSISLSWSMQW